MTQELLHFHEKKIYNYNLHTSIRHKLKIQEKSILKEMCPVYVLPKVLMQGKLIAVVYTLRTYIETSFLWVEFVNKNRCISVRL